MGELSPAFAPVGYCRCGYPTDPGVCPECGRTNHRVHRLNPRGLAARRVRWVVRIVLLAALSSGLFFGGKYALWNWWPLDQIQYLSTMPGSGWWSTCCRDLGDAVLDHRLRRLFDLAHARYEVFRNLPLPAREPRDDSARYTDASRTLHVHEGEFVISQDSMPAGTRDVVRAYGTVARQSDAELVLHIKWNADWRRLPPRAAPNEEVYVKGLLHDTPFLIMRSMVGLYMDTLRLSRVHEQDRTYLRHPGVFVPEDVIDPLPFLPNEDALQLPLGYCVDEAPSLQCLIEDVSTTPNGPTAWTETLRLNVGAAHGVYRHLTFYLVSQDNPALFGANRFRVRQLDATTCTVDRILPAYLMDPRNPYNRSILLPEVGMLMQTEIEPRAPLR